MNNLSNYDMFSRALRQQKDDYEQRYTDKQDAQNESTALLYEGLTAPFIEQSGMNLLKKGIRRGAKSIGLSDDVINSVQSIGEDIKAGNWSEAGRKIVNARKNPVFNPEQQKFLNEKQNLLDSLRGKKPLDIPSNLEELPQGLSMSDASTGKAIKQVKQIVKPTETAVVKDEDGNVLPDSNVLERQNLEDRIASGRETEAELSTLKGRLRAMIGESSAPQELSPQARAKQSVESFLKKYKKVKPEDTDIVPTSASKPLINPRDVAQDIDVPEGGGYARGLNGYRVDARNIKAQPSVAEPADLPGVPAPEVDRIIGQEVTPTPAQLDTLARADKGDFTVKNPARSAELKDIYGKLSDNGQRIYEDKINKAGLDRYDYDGRQQLLQQASAEDKAQIAQSQPKPAPSSVDVPDSTSTKPPVSEPDAPPVDDKPSVLEDVGKSLEKGASVDAELGGPEDIVGDVVAGAISVGTLLFGLNSAHKDSQPPPIKQVNPTLQYGTGQI